jgi:hypothetical protein
VVLPFSVWAWRRLKAEGVPVRGGASSWWGLAGFPLAVAGVHAAAHALTRPRRADRVRAGVAKGELSGRGR